MRFILILCLLLWIECCCSFACNFNTYIVFQFTDNHYMTRADCVATLRSLLKIIYHGNNGRILLMHNPSASFAESKDERVQFENCANSFSTQHSSIWLYFKHVLTEYLYGIHRMFLVSTWNFAHPSSGCRLVHWINLMKEIEKKRKLNRQREREVDRFGALNRLFIVSLFSSTKTKRSRMNQIRWTLSFVFIAAAVAAIRYCLFKHPLMVPLSKMLLFLTFI